MIGSPHTEAQALINLALDLAFRSPFVTAKLEPWLVAPRDYKPERTERLLPVICSKCGYQLGTMEGGWIKAGACSHCPTREVPFDKMLGMARALVGGYLGDQVVLVYLEANPLREGPREVETRQPIQFIQAPVAPTHKIINIDGLLDAVLNE